MTTLLRYAAAALAYMGSVQAEGQIPLSGSSLDDYACKHPPYNVQILSRSPMVVYIEDFITADERAHLQDLAYVRYDTFYLRVRLIAN